MNEALSERTYASRSIAGRKSRVPLAFSFVLRALFFVNRVNKVRTVFSAQPVAGRRCLVNSEAVCGALAQRASMTVHSASARAGGRMLEAVHYKYSEVSTTNVVIARCFTVRSYIREGLNEKLDRAGLHSTEGDSADISETKSKGYTRTIVRSSPKLSSVAFNN